MKKINKLLIAVIWGLIVYALFKLNLINGDTDKLTRFLDSLGQYKTVLFVLLSTLRVAALIPSSVFMIFGGMVFGPVEGFFLTVLSILLSESIIYMLSKVMVGLSLQNRLIDKHPKLHRLLQKNNEKILVIGILCPVAPSDIICFLAGSLGLKYKRFIATVVIGNMPMAVLYSFLGNSVLSSLNSTLIIGGIVLLVSVISIYLWNRAQRNTKVSYTENLESQQKIIDAVSI